MNRLSLLCVGVVLSTLGTLSGQSFRVVGIPDTQNYSEFFPAIFTAQTQWIANERAARDIRYVSHFGDVVNDGDQLWQWANADQSMAILDAAGIPYGVTPGNHDVTPTGSAGTAYIPQFFRSFFGPSRFQGRPWYRGTSPSEMSSYQVFFAGGIEWLALHIECDGPLRELSWAQEIIDQHRHMPVLMTTHRYIQDAEDYTAGVPIVPSGRYPSIWYLVEGFYVPDGNQSNDIFDWFVRRNPNIFMVMCGHFHEEFRQTSTNVAGKPVHEVLADYQDDPNGGDGWLRIMNFDLGNNRIDFESYSPTLNATRTADESLFSLNVNWSDYFERRPTLALQEGIAGYQGTVDTWIDEANGNTSYGNSGVIVVDDDVRNNLFNDRRGQGLLRFEGLTDPGRIPAGSRIVSATLTIQISDDIDSPIFDPDFFLHRVFVPWSEGSTWNSLGGGLSVGAELSPALATIAGDNNPDSDGIRRIDVTSVVQDWVNGAPNFGFAILPEIISGNDDGIEILSSESLNPLLRPRLEIVYEGPFGYFSYESATQPVNELSLYGLGQPRVGTAVDLVVSGVAAPVALIGIAAAAADAPAAGGTLLIDPAGILLVATEAVDLGAARLQIALPQDPAFVGLEVFAQGVAFEATSPAGIRWSNGLRVVIAP